MAINQQTLERFWNDVRNQLHRRWSQLSNEDLQRVRGNVEQLVSFVQEKTGTNREQVRQFLEQVTSNLRSAVEQSSDRARQSLQQARETTDDTLHRASDSLRAGYIQTGRTVRRHPMESVAAVFATGLLSGLLIASIFRSR